MRKILSVIGRWVFSVGCVVVAIVAALYVIDSDKPLSGLVGQLDLYPYEGFRNRANVHTFGVHHDFDIRFGELGLFTDFDVRNPPPKEKDEIRIILIGGSGAMGQGARSNEDMLYRKLELRLNELMKDSGWRIRVINLAHGGSVTYQSFIALNRWGHEIDPDIILSYSGRNDIYVPLSEGSDGHLLFRTLNYLVTASDRDVEDDEPWLIRFIARQFPRLYKNSSIPFLLKTTIWPERYQEIADTRYTVRRGLPASLRCCGSNDPIGLATVKQIATRTTIHGLRSIKRDFLGIPIVLGWEAMAPSEFPFYFLSSDYNLIFDTVADGVRGYTNDDWLLINVHHALELDPKPYIATHLGNEGHTVVANFLAEKMIVMVKQVAGHRGNEVTNPLNNALKSGLR